ncbi:MAG: 16S rRNA (uracil(1498)-N(3))-methyltransferase [Proteobacteria bacterium]|nr:16S rRNA (uracil(1498)-N(3))-methyltransferase [Pseudomonadota bacterium]
MKHLFVAPEDITAEGVRLRGDDFHHVVRVLRLRPGADLALVDGTGMRYTGRLARIDRREAWVTLDERQLLAPDPPPRLLLIDGLARSERTHWVLQKATELGVDEFVPALCARSVARPSDVATKLERWQEIARQAARQCERARLPLIHPPRPWASALTQVPNEALRLVAMPGASGLAALETRLRDEANAVAIAVGPEGGLTAEELQQARDAGFEPVALGPRILRTETAAIALLALAAYLSGRLAD